MPTLLDRHIDEVSDRLLLLAPPQRLVPQAFKDVVADETEYVARLGEVQRLRGEIYFRDGAVRRDDLTRDGLHRTPEDDVSWHLLMLDDDGQVTAGMWYMEHPRAISADQLRVRHCPAGMRRESRDAFWRAVNDELRQARRGGLGYAELGGWFVVEHCRRSCDGLLLALGAFSLGRMLGGALGLTTATVRHSSSTILRKIGGEPLKGAGQVIGPYFDPQYQCEMELIRFDSRRPDARFAGSIERLKDRLATVHIVECGDRLSLSQDDSARAPVRVIAA